MKGRGEGNGLSLLTSWPLVMKKDEGWKGHSDIHGLMNWPPSHSFSNGDDDLFFVGLEFLDLGLIKLDHEYETWNG